MARDSSQPTRPFKKFEGVCRFLTPEKPPAPSVRSALCSLRGFHPDHRFVACSLGDNPLNRCF